MKPVFYESLGETVYQEVLPNGLQIRVVPKPDHAKKSRFWWRWQWCSAGWRACWCFQACCRG